MVLVGAIVSAAAFAFTCYAPWRALPAVAATTTLGHLAYLALRDPHQSMPWAAACAAMVIGAVSYSIAGRVRVPPLVVVVPAIVPMLPGLSIYRGLTYLSAGDSQGILQLTAAAATTIALAAGVILGEYVAQPLKRQPAGWSAAWPARAWSACCTGTSVVGTGSRCSRTPCAHRLTAVGWGIPAASGRPDDGRCLSMRPTSRATAAVVASLAAALVASPGLAAPAPARCRRPGCRRPGCRRRAGRRPLPRTPEVATSTRLAARRSLVVGDRFWGMGAEDGSYPATGFHTRGEMGGFWTPPIKLLDGIWFKAGGTWLTATRYTSGWGYQRMDLGTHEGVTISRTDVAPPGLRAGLIGLRLSTRRARTLHLALDAHSELMKAYPGARRRRARRPTTCPTPGAWPAGACSSGRWARRRWRTRNGTTTRPWWGRGWRRRAARSVRRTAVRRATWSARRPDRAHRRSRLAATTRRTARAPGASCATRSGCRVGAPRSGSRSPAPTAGSPTPVSSRCARCGTRPGCWPARSRLGRRSRRTAGSSCPVTRCCSAASRGASRTSPSRCRRHATCRSG